MHIEYARFVECAVCSAVEAIADDDAGNLFSEIHGSHAPNGYLADGVRLVAMYNPTFAAISSLFEPTVREIAAWTALSPDTVRRNITRLLDEGFIEQTQGRPARFRRPSDG